MRPCRQCRAPIENQAATCPHCGASQAGGPRAIPAPDPVRPGFLRRFAAFFVLTPDADPLAVFAVFGMPIILCGLVGYAYGGVNGALIGGAVGVGLLLLAAALLAIEVSER